MDSSYFQHKRKKEKEEYYKKYPHKKERFLDENTIAWILLGSFIFIFIAGLLYITATTQTENLNECEEVGGKYVIVDRTFAGKSAVDIYGCVK